MAKLALILKGQRAGKIVSMSTEDFDKAIAAGWAAPMNTRQRADRPGPHAGSDKYFGYATREQRAAPNPEEPAPKVKAEPRKPTQRK